MDMKNICSIIQMQTRLLEDAMRRELETAETPEERISITNKYAKKFFLKAGKPLLEITPAERGHLPFIENHNKMSYEIVEDLDILYDEMELFGDQVVEAFNYNQNEKTRLKNKIAYLSSLASDFNLVANETENNVVYFNESFNSYDNIDTEVSTGSPINIGTSEGIATLARVVDVNHSPEASIKLITGNGDTGNYHVITKVNTTTDDGSAAVGAKFISDDSPNDDPVVIIDGRPDTWYEFQLVNASDEAKAVAKGYDIDWARGNQNGERLRLKIVIELKQVQPVNWIYINPYYPKGSTGKMHVYSLKTSKDGIEYQPVNPDVVVMDSTISSVPQTYRKDVLLVDEYFKKHNQMGVFSFPITEAKFIEVVLDQPESYNESIGHTFYEKVLVKEDPVPEPPKEPPTPDIKPLGVVRKVNVLSETLSFSTQQPKAKSKDGKWDMKGYDFDKRGGIGSWSITKSGDFGEYSFIPFPKRGYTEADAKAYWNSYKGQEMNIRTEPGASPQAWRMTGWTGVSTITTQVDYGKGGIRTEEFYNTTFYFSRYSRDPERWVADYRSIACDVDDLTQCSMIEPYVGTVRIDNIRVDNKSRMAIDVVMETGVVKDSKLLTDSNFGHVIYNGISFTGDISRTRGPLSEHPLLSGTGTRVEPLEMSNQPNYFFSTKEEAQAWAEKFMNATKAKPLRVPADNPVTRTSNYYDKLIEDSVCSYDKSIVGDMTVERYEVLEATQEEMQKLRLLDAADPTSKPISKKYKVVFFGPVSTEQKNPIKLPNGWHAEYSGTLYSEVLKNPPKPGQPLSKNITASSWYFSNELPPAGFPATHKYEDDEYYGMLSKKGDTYPGIDQNKAAGKKTITVSNHFNMDIIASDHYESYQNGEPEKDINYWWENKYKAQAEARIGTQMFSGASGGVYFTATSYTVNKNEDQWNMPQVTYQITYSGTAEVDDIRPFPTVAQDYAGVAYLKTLYNIDGTPKEGSGA